MRRIYVLDTNILIHDPNSLLAFDDRDVIIPMTVIEELDNKKKAKGDVGYNSREATRILQDMRKHGNLCIGVTTEHGGTISVRDYSINLRSMITATGSFDVEKNDNKILLTAATVAKSEPWSEVILVTNDANMQVKADGLNSVIPENMRFGTQFYRRDRLEDKDFAYKGRRVVETEGSRVLSPDGFQTIGVHPKILGVDQDNPATAFTQNEFVEVRHPSGDPELGYFRDGKVFPLTMHPVFGVTPRNAGQIFALAALMAPLDDVPLVILRGQAGTAKTFLSLAAGLEQVYETSVYKNILYTRANVEFDRDIGALPGDEQEKMGPLVRPCMDNLEALFGAHGSRGMKDDRRLPSITEELISEGYIRFESMSFMRGRSIARSFIIIDEAQNCSIGQIKGLLTRPSTSKVIICGDESQIDNRYLDLYSNGLSTAAKAFRGSRMCAQLTFTEEECTRSPLAAEAAKLL